MLIGLGINILGIQKIRHEHASLPCGGGTATLVVRMKAKDDKLGLWLLIFVALGSMIGSGIFNSPRDLISVANPQGTLITWVIGGFSALMLALVFVYLAGRKPS